jgi:hypothetical protein
VPVYDSKLEEGFQIQGQGQLKEMISDASPTRLVCMAKLPNLGFQTSKAKIRESTVLLYLDFLLRFGQVLYLYPYFEP